MPRYGRQAQKWHSKSTVRVADTNLLVRLLLGDDAKQLGIVKKLVQREQLFVPNTVLLELGWVLESLLPDKKHVSPALALLLPMQGLQLENPPAARLALAWYEQGMDLADALHLALSQLHSGFLTFDEKMVKKATKVKPASRCTVGLP